MRHLGCWRADGRGDGLELFARGLLHVVNYSARPQWGSSVKLIVRVEVRRERAPDKFAELFAIWAKLLGAW